MECIVEEVTRDAADFAYLLAYSQPVRVGPARMQSPPRIAPIVSACSPASFASCEILIEEFADVS